jgi:hypothetical protein
MPRVRPTAADFEAEDIVVERRLGSTEIAAVAALYVPALRKELPRHTTAADVFARIKWGLNKKKNRPMERGNEVEPQALNYYRQHVGPCWRPLPSGEFWTIQHPEYEWATASPDAYDAPSPRIVIEAKSQSEWARKQWGLPGTDQMATRYLFQCLWLAMCSGAELVHVVCMFGWDVPADKETPAHFEVTEPALYFCRRDAGIESQLVDYGERFWNDFVRTGKPPPVKPGPGGIMQFKERLFNERGLDAVREWEAQCIAESCSQAV